MPDGQQDLPFEELAKYKAPPAQVGGAEPDWRQMFAGAGRVFQPTTPVSVLDVFSGRMEQLTRVCDVVMQPGQHAILFGERGVGKTSLANVLSSFLVVTEAEAELGPIISPRVNCDAGDTFDSVWRKVLARITVSSESQPIGFNVAPNDEEFDALQILGPEFQGAESGEGDARITPEVVRRALARLGRSSIPILIIDEFDQLSPAPRKAFADLIKMLSDHAVAATVVLVGVSESVDGLLRDHESVARALVQVKMPRMGREEIRGILIKGAEKLGMRITEPALRRITAISQGLPHYAHLLGQHATREALKQRSLDIGPEHVRSAIARATEDAQQSVQKAYHEGIRSAQKGSLFADVLLSCAMARCDELGYFKAQDVREPMCLVTGKQYDIPNFAQHLSDFSSEKRGRILHVVGEKRRLSYHFRDPLMQPFVLMQGEVTGRLPEDFFDSFGTES